MIWLCFSPAHELPGLEAFRTEDLLILSSDHLEEDVNLVGEVEVSPWLGSSCLLIMSLSGVHRGLSWGLTVVWLIVLTVDGLISFRCLESIVRTSWCFFWLSKIGSNLIKTSFDLHRSVRYIAAECLDFLVGWNVVLANRLEISLGTWAMWPLQPATNRPEDELWYQWKSRYGEIMDDFFCFPASNLHSSNSFRVLFHRFLPDLSPWRKVWVVKSETQN